MGMVFGIMREETPAFALVHKAATYEVRRYTSSIIAECAYGAGGWNGNNGDRSPFGALARYIGVFGTPANSKAGAIAMTAPVLITPSKPEPEPIAMTAPVLVSPTANGDTMSFVLPASRFKTIDEAPQPTDPRVTLRVLPERLQAVRTFTWSFKREWVDENLQSLLADLQRDGWQPKKGASGEVEWQAAGYNPPFTLPFMKRNEVLVSVADKE